MANVPVRRFYDEIFPYLAEFRKICEEELNRCAETQAVDGAINWGDLHVVDVFFGILDYDQLPVWRCHIEEACEPKLEDWMAQAIAARWHEAGVVDVKTEW